MVLKQGWICYREKKTRGSLNLRVGNSKLVVSSPLLPCASPFVVSMCFPCSSVEMKNNSRCSVKLCGRKSLRQVHNSGIIPSQALYLPWESSQAGHCHLWQQRPQMSLKGPPCSGPVNNTVTLELTTMNCGCLFNPRARWAQSLVFFCILRIYSVPGRETVLSVTIPQPPSTQHGHVSVPYLGWIVSLFKLYF